MDEISGFSLSQEELLAALLIAELPAPPGFDQLEARVFGDLPAEFRGPLLAATERSLLAHGLLRIEPDSVVLDETVAATLRICTQPERSWIILHQNPAQGERASYFHQAADRVLAHIETAGIHQFLDLGSSADITATLLQLVAPKDTPENAAMTGDLAESTFATLVQANQRPASSALRAQLVSNGLAGDVAEAFAHTLETLVSITACARFQHGTQSLLQRAFTIVSGAQAQWALTVHKPGVLRIQWISGDQLRRLVQDFGHVA